MNTLFILIHNGLLSESLLYFVFVEFKVFQVWVLLIRLELAANFIGQNKDELKEMNEDEVVSEKKGDDDGDDNNVLNEETEPKEV